MQGYNPQNIQSKAVEANSRFHFLSCLSVTCRRYLLTPVLVN